MYFHEDNVHAQCAKCNLFLQGNTYEYGIKLGKRRVNKLYKLKQSVVYPPWDEVEYNKKIAYYTKELSKLISKKNEAVVSRDRRSGKNPKRSK